MLKYVYKCLNGQGPEYLTELLEVYIPSRDLRSASKFILVVPRCQTKTGGRSLSISGPTLWNSLPEDIKNDSSIGIFKKTVKNLLFKKLYS